jgi:D-serine deaminase-like pyridoxal phosphate-dependent protein
MPISPVRGAVKSSFDTPAYCLDLDRFEANLAYMAETIRAAGKAWRPHAKGHKSPAVAWRQIRAGAIGVTCAKVSEAEVMIQSGIPDVLIANVIAGEPKCDRLATLCKAGRPIICCDHYAQAEPIAAACRRWGVHSRVLVDVNIGLDRTGIRPGRDALELGQALSKLPDLELVGIMGYEGHLMKVPDQTEKQHKIAEALGILKTTRDQFLEHGLKCEIVSAGGSGSLAFCKEAEGITELQSGGGIFGDPFYVDACQQPGVKPALTILATVTSRGALERAVLDSGRKTVNPDIHPPVVKGFADAQVVSLSAEHCTLKLGPESQRLKIGDKVELFVGYADFTTILHEEFLCFRGDKLEAVWPILGRGKLQ